MKKFLIGAISVFALFLCLQYAFYYHGFYLDFHPNAAVSIPYRTEGQSILRQEKNGEYTPLVLRGVDLSASMPGKTANAFLADEEDYLRWFDAIAEMGANAVRVTNVMDDSFYNAFYTYNASHTSPLYLLQGTSISDYASNNSQDAYQADYFNRLLQDGMDLVDIIHGRKSIAINSMRGSGNYRRDISQWVAGFLVGNEWMSDTIAYTNHSVLHDTSYRGEYFATAEESNVFEAMLAQVMDRVTAYETKKYKTQRPIGFTSSPANDFLEYETVYARQLMKYVQINAENVRPTQKMHAGCFAAYQLYDFCDNFTQYLSVSQKAALSPILSNLNTDGFYGGYLQLLQRYHTIPVIAAGYGFSSSRGATKKDVPPLTEQEQGEHLAALSRELEADGWAGGFVSTWQDTWERRTWNTAFATVPTRNYLWHDLQTDDQNYGLMAYDPGETERICLIDGESAEWDEADRVLQNGDFTLSAKYDAECLYLLVQKQNLNPQDRIYIPIDISPEVGSSSCESPILTFDRKADFLIDLSGKNYSRLLVQNRYDAMRENFLIDITGQDPFQRYPSEDSSTFTVVKMVLQNPLLLDKVTDDNRALKRSATWDTGKLVHGNGNPSSPSYNSLADFCYGQDCVEIRLPWLLLNVADPSSMSVHRDYYEHYGVETTDISECWLGVAESGSGTIPMQSFSLDGWGRSLEWHERLKQSYFVLQAEWKGGGADATDN